MTLLAVISFLILAITTLKYWIEFAGDFFGNLSIKKVIGALLVFGSLWLLGAGQQSGDADKFVLFAGLALLVGGVGAAITYYDMARDKVYGKGQYDELGTLTKAYDRKEREDRKPAGWHMLEENKEKDKN